MPKEGKEYELFFATQSGGDQGYSGMSRRICPYFPADGSGYYFPGYHAWHNRRHTGDGPLFHAVSDSMPPNRYIYYKGVRYLYIGFEEDMNPTGLNYSCQILNGKTVRVGAINLVESKGRYRVRGYNLFSYEYLYYYSIDPERGIIYGTTSYSTYASPYMPNIWFDTIGQARAWLKGEMWTLKVQQTSPYRLTANRYVLWASPFPEGPALFDKYPHNEWGAYQGWLELGIDGLPNLYRSGFSSAYANAVAELPEIRCNMIANILDIISTLKDIRHGEFWGGIRRTLKDPRKLWLSYRYAYTTTKLDMQETRGVISRLKNLMDNGPDFQVNGVYRRGDQLFRAVLTVPFSTVLPDTAFVSKLDKLGIKISAYNLWDMVPYSFVVDWFLGVGNLLEWAENVNESLAVRPSNVWYSCQTRTEDLTIYFRIPADGMVGMPFYNYQHASERTFLMRCADAISLFT